LIGAGTYHFIASEEAEDAQPFVAQTAFGTEAILK
jgi:hypothetical protein